MLYISLFPRNYKIGIFPESHIFIKIQKFNATICVECLLNNGVIESAPFKTWLNGFSWQTWCPSNKINWMLYIIIQIYIMRYFWNCFSYYPIIF